MLADPIVQQTQPHPHSCMATCAAMIVGLPAEVVENHIRIPANTDEAINFLTHHRLRCTEVRDNECRQGFVYLVSVASLNMPGKLHAVVLDWRGEAPLIFDPNVGREGRLCVTPEAFMKGDVGWFQPVRIIDCELLEKSPTLWYRDWPESKEFPGSYLCSPVQPLPKDFPEGTRWHHVGAEELKGAPQGSWKCRDCGQEYRAAA